MQSRTRSGAIVVVLVAAAVVLFVVLRGDGDDTERAAPTTTPAGVGAKNQQRRKKPESEATTIVVRGGEPVGGVQELEYTRGDEIRLRVRSDVADEVHVHGYDHMERVGPGEVATFDFPAEIDGGFEIELEGSHKQLAELTVEPG